MLISATDFVDLFVCSPLVTIGFSTSKQQFVRRELLLARLAHGSGRAVMTTMVESSLGEGCILEEGSWQPERQEKGVL
jgi:hypothetical protein